MRIDEKRVARGEATLWRTLLRKGPKKPSQDSRAEIFVTSEGADNGLNKDPHIGMERDLQNLTV